MTISLNHILFFLYLIALVCFSVSACAHQEKGTGEDQSPAHRYHIQDGPWSLPERRREEDLPGCPQEGRGQGGQGLICLLFYLLGCEYERNKQKKSNLYICFCLVWSWQITMVNPFMSGFPL